MLCKGKTKAKTGCSRTVKEGEYCFQHGPEKEGNVEIRREIVGGLTIGDLSLFEAKDSPDILVTKWEAEYARIMDPKYKKNTRNFSTTLRAIQHPPDSIVDPPNPPIYLIPRMRGGPSYKSIPLEGCNPDDVVYAPISKGFPMQDVSSFTLGPIVGEGLCLVNSAFSKSICTFHLEGGGSLDLKRKMFWRRAKQPMRYVLMVDDAHIQVDGVIYETFTWLKENEHLWLCEWEQWRRHIAMSSMGSFHWCGDFPTVSYRYQNRYINFVTWKKECYIRPSYELTPLTTVYQFLTKVRCEGRSLGLVHPMAISDQPERPITREYIRALFDSPTEMCCQPFVVAGLLLGVPIN